MPKSLLIVESPAKAKTINKYLGKDFTVEATVGHIKNLPSKELGVDIENGFTPKYVTIRGKGDIIKGLQQKAAKAKDVYIATDPDREGEAIAQHIAVELERAAKGKEIYRVLFNEITKSGVREAMAHTRSIDQQMVKAQQARRIMDRIVGYKVSPVLWKTIYKGLSAGRVQSVALRFMAERELEIGAFQKTEYWTITGEFHKPDDGSFHAKLVKIDNEEPVIPDETIARDIVDRCMQREFSVSDIQSREVNRMPSAPFITSSMQQEASNRLRFSASRTMRVSQQLYEGVELGEEGAVGLITYIRTDSTRISNEALDAVREYIGRSWGKEFVPEAARVFKVKSTAQDAHEAIRPTSMEYTPERVRKHLSPEQYALYELIWKRFVACQMAADVLDQTSVFAKGGEFLFKGVGSVYKFRGFLQVYDDYDTENGIELNEEESIIPDTLAPGDALEPQFEPHRHETKPPPRYTESSLVRELEAKGIGRPSTYALIVSTILDRGYVEQKERRLFVTTLGMDVYKMLMNYFEQLFNVDFTARMEQELDTIATGEADYETVMREFYGPFIKLVESVSLEEARLAEKTDEVCELCGSPMIIRWGRNGKFLACSAYPGCRSTRPLADEVERTKITDPCPDCGGELLLKQSRYGKFIGCKNYPTCKYTRPITLGIQCPKCHEGEIVERLTKTKRTFYGCSKYPACDFVSWERPVAQQCPSCQNPYLSQKYSQKKGEYLRCPTCKSEFTKELDPFDPLMVAA